MALGVGMAVVGGEYMRMEWRILVIRVEKQRDFMPVEKVMMPASARFC